MWAAFGGKRSTGMEILLYVNIVVLSVATMPTLGPPAVAVWDPEEERDVGVLGAVKEACIKLPSASIMSPKTFVECNCMS